MRQYGGRRAKNSLATAWQAEVALVLKAAGLRPWVTGSCVGYATTIYYYLRTPDMDVDAPEKALQDAVVSALGARHDRIGRVLYQDAWNITMDGDKEFGAKLLQVWVTSEYVGSKARFNTLARERRARKLLLYGYPHDDGLEDL